MHKLFLGLFALAFAPLMGAPAHASADDGGLLRVDATAPLTPAGAADYKGGSNRTPSGTVLDVTDRYLTLAGKPWIPVMGEMHYARVPESEWDADLAKLKAAGVDVVSTYIIWIYHEEVRGQWDWTNNRDLRRFAELCQKHGLLLMVRIGPWAHAETRHGGLPDWVVEAGPTRQTDPKFMSETKAFYDQIGTQLRGLLWKDGGPVAGVQIENEYGQTGPGKGADYLLALKDLALRAGLDVPLYTVTGWDNAVVPKGEFLPVFGGYPAAPWGGTTAKLPPQEVYAFRFSSRVSGNMGMIGAVPPANGKPTSAPATTAATTPFLTAEVGGGIEDTYHRRPVIQADDIAAMAPVMLGSGVNGYGSYMMVGGQDAIGKLSTFQESQNTGYPTDVPVKSYDFQAPIGEFGRERRSLRLLKQWNYFMRDFGSLLAPMPVFAPSIRPADPKDLSILRWSVRTNGRTGFLFVNNYVRGAAMPARHGVQFSVSLPQGREMKIPARPLDVPSGSFFAWPFGLQLGQGVELQYATAQLMTRIPANANGASMHVFFCIPEVRCELSLEGKGLTVTAPRGIAVERSADTALLRTTNGADALSVITIRSGDASSAHETRLLLLTGQAAENAWTLPVAGAESLVRTSADIWVENGGVALSQLGEPQFKFSVYPSEPVSFTADVPVEMGPAGEYRAALPPVQVQVSLEQMRAAGSVPPVHLGPPLPWRPTGVAQAPDEKVWAADAGQWHLNVSPQQLPAGVSNLFLRLQYVGDEARLTGNSELLDDNFWNGRPWMIGLRRFASGNVLPHMQLQILPVRADAPVYFADEACAQLPLHGQKIEVKSIEAIPEYTVRIKTAETTRN